MRIRLGFLPWVKTGSPILDFIDIIGISFRAAKAIPKGDLNQHRAVNKLVAQQLTTKE